MKDAINRRIFLRQAGAAGLGLSVVGYFGCSTADTGAPMPFATGRTIGPNDKLTFAVIGTNGRGLAHVDCLLALRGVEISHICDVDDRAIVKGIKAAAKKQQTGPKGAKDFRKLLEDKTIDAVSIATPDHWHAPMAILALQAGKHVYVEKPCSHNPHEGELLVQAAARSKSLCQMGSQRRSFPNTQAAVKALREGMIGKTYMGRCWYVNNRTSIGRGQPVAVPEWLDYELWQGPALRRPYMSNLIHYNWHWFWNYGTGEALNNGTHEVDVCRWAMGLDFPSRVTSNGGRFAFDDDWETPDTQVISWDFAAGKAMTWEGHSCNKQPIEGLERGVVIYGAGGSAVLEGDNCKIVDNSRKVLLQLKSGAVADPTNTISASGADMDTLHFKNFVDAIRLGTPLSAPVSEGHKSVAMLQLGNIAWRTGRELVLDPANGHIKNDAAAMKLWRRDYARGWEPKV
ncbi:MAG TPA: Gfo/Idh/MocA family oxidoreductase [Candidatus Acidoferrum sp.]|nr:Gfo/Idh/MocA family oxidoreductase [Candidatus Acidoferrum sp.]